MKTVGSLLIIVGIAAVWFAFVMDTTVSSPGTYIAESYVGGGSTYNLGLLQQQMMVFQSGLASFIAGAVLFGAGSLEEASDSRKLKGDLPGAREWTERDKLVHRIILGAGVVFVIVVVALIAMQKPSSSGTSMNVAENLTTNDMNATEENLFR
jgi:hypothetical protein